MTKIDLITGFLGSGKTTFLKIYAKYLMDSGLSIGILENDYGAVNVDMMLLGDLEGDNCELEMVAGGCCQDCHTRRFKTKLIALGMSGYDRVIVEPSGIFDVDEFFDVLREEPLNHMYEIGSVIAIVDSRLESELSDESDYYLASQIANAGTILLSRSQLTDAKHITSVTSHLDAAAKKVGIDRNVLPIIKTNNWLEFTPDDLCEIMNSGYHIASYTKLIAGQGSTYSSIYFLELKMTAELIMSKIRILMNNSEYGDIFRIKGFFLENGKWYQINATKQDITLEEITLGQEVIIIIGEHLNKEAIETVMKSV